MNVCHTCVLLLEASCCCCDCLTVWPGLGQLAEVETETIDRLLKPSPQMVAFFSRGETSYGGVEASGGGGQEPEGDALCFQTRTVANTAALAGVRGAWA